jgi:hypothetical protein
MGFLPTDHCSGQDELQGHACRLAAAGAAFDRRPEQLPPSSQVCSLIERTGVHKFTDRFSAMASKPRFRSRNDISIPHYSSAIGPAIYIVEDLPQLLALRKFWVLNTRMTTWLIYRRRSMFEPKGRGWPRHPVSCESDRRAGCAPIYSATAVACRLLIYQNFSLRSLFDSPHKIPVRMIVRGGFEPKYRVRSHSDLGSQDEHASTPSHGGRFPAACKYVSRTIRFPGTELVRGGYGDYR